VAGVFETKIDHVISWFWSYTAYKIGILQKLVIYLSLSNCF